MRWYLSKGCKIEQGRWTGNPQDLAYYADEGDTQWHIVTDEIRKEACRKKKKRTEADAELFTPKRKGNAT
jgi:hypothetical protein